MKYNEPLVPQRADPYVYRHTDGYYYFTGSVPAYDVIELRRSRTINGLSDAEPVVIWKKHDSGPMSKHIWAPELHFIDGAWYIYFAAGRAENIWDIRPYVLECKGDDPLAGPWIERGMMRRADSDTTSFSGFSLDATTFEHRSERYFIWAEKTSFGSGLLASNLYIAKMESPTKLKTDAIQLSTPDYDWERVGFWVDEGPAVLKHGGRIFVTFSASATGACYCMGILEASEDADLLDRNSWRKSRYPVLKSIPEKNIYGPGHNSFTVAEDGVTTLCVYHARPYEKIVGDPLYDPNRHARVLEVRFTDDGRPIFEP